MERYSPTHDGDRRAAVRVTSPSSPGPRRRAEHNSPVDPLEDAAMTARTNEPSGPETMGSSPKLVLATLAAGQFLMALDSSVMNVSIATVARDVGTTVTGVQGAITAYTLVMAMFMIPGGKVGALVGRKRAFMIGCVHLRLRLAHDRARAEPAGAAARLVLPRRDRGGADHAGDRGARRGQLRQRNADRPPTDSSRPPEPWPSRSGRSSAVSPRRTSPGAGCSPARSRGARHPPARPPRHRAPTGPSARRIDVVGAALCALGLGDLRVRRPALRASGAGSCRSPVRPPGSASRRPCGSCWPACS